MKIFGKIFLWLLVAMLAAWQIPWLIRYFAAVPSHVPFTLYSTVIEDFAMIRTEGEELEFIDRAGHRYTEKGFDSILPLFYARQLNSEGRFPDSVSGRAVNIHEVLEHNFFFNSHPSDINCKKTGIYFLMESCSGRVDLEMPDDAFRFTSGSGKIGGKAWTDGMAQDNGGIEFIDMKKNDVLREKSEMFTSTMAEAGFSFPPKCLSGNPGTRKEYDEGYIIIDAADKLFHLKMVKGRPYIRLIDLPSGVVPEHAFITEFGDRRTIAFFTDTYDRMYAVCMPGYVTVRIGYIPESGIDKTCRTSDTADCTFDPTEESIYIIGNLIDWTVRINSETSTRYYAINANDFSLISFMEYPSEPSWAERVPGIQFTSSKDKYVKPRIRK